MIFFAASNSAQPDPLYFYYELSAPLALGASLVILIVLFVYASDNRRIARAAQESAKAAVKSVSDAQAYAKKASCLQMLSIWHSAEAISYRREGWVWLHDLKRTAEQEAKANSPSGVTPLGPKLVVYIGKYRKSQLSDEGITDQEQAKYYHVSSVYHFIADVAALVETEQADKQLADTLFAETFKGWLKLLEWVCRARNDEDSQDNNSDSPAAIAWFVSELGRAYPLYCPELQINAKGMAEAAVRKPAGLRSSAGATG